MGLQINLASATMAIRQSCMDGSLPILWQKERKGRSPAGLLDSRIKFSIMPKMVRNKCNPREADDAGGSCCRPKLFCQCSLHTFDVVLHVFLVARRDMQTVWFPVPVAALFRRIVNVVSTLSISHHYLHQPPADADPPRTHAFQALRWPAWLRVSQTPWNLSLADGSGASTNPQGDDDLQEPPRRTMSPSRPRRNDQIHQLISHPTLYDPVRKPRYPIVLCHGTCTIRHFGMVSIPTTDRSLRV